MVTMSDRPWLMRTYSGHSSARASNELYRTQPRQGPDRPVGRVRPADPDRLRPRPPARARRGGQGRRAGAAPRRDARALRRDPARGDEHLDDDQRHRDVAASACTSRWPRSAASTRRCSRAPRRTTSSRSTCRAAPTSSGPRRRGGSPSTSICHTVRHVPKWNPINVCSYHLQEAGATPVEEIAYALATAIDVLDAVRESGQVTRRRVPRGRRAHLVLRERRHPLRRGDVQDARAWPRCGTASPRSATASPTRSCAASATACR